MYKIHTMNKMSQISEENFRIILDSIGDAVIVTDTEGKVVRLNPVAQRLCGWNMEEALAKPLEEIFHIVNAETGEPVENPCKQVMAKGSAVGLANHTMLISRDGRRYQIADSASPIRDDNNAIRGVVLVFRNVTEEYENRKRLRESERQLREAQKLAHIGVWSWTAATDTVKWSEELYHIAGLNPAEPAPTYAEHPKIYTPESMEHLGKAVESSLNFGEPYDLELQLLRPDGEIRDVYAFGGPAYSEDGKIMGLYGTVQDITERKNYERALRESEQWFKSLYEDSPIAIEIYDPEGKLIQANRACLNLFGVTDVSQISGFSLFEDPNVTDDIKNRLKQGENVSYDVPFDFNKVKENNLYETSKSGWMYISVYISPLYKEEKKGIYGYVVKVLDLTERRLKEEELKKEKYRISSILEGTHVGTWEWNVQTNETTINNRWAEIIGYSVEELSPVSFDTWKEFTHPEDYEKSKALLQKHFSGELDFYESECRMKHKNGHWVWVLDRGKVATWTNDGKPLWMYGTHQDITKQKQALEEKTFLMRELNHRVKNNLSMVSSLIHLKDISLGREVDLSDLNRQIDAIRIVYDKLYKTENVGRIDVKGYIQEILQTVFSLSGMVIQLDHHLEELMLPSSRAVPIGLIVNELATNAVKHGFSGTDTPRFTIKLSNDEANKLHMLSISNNGPPFPEDVVPENHENLGLRLVSALAEQLGGSFELKRTPYPVFIINFPEEDTP